MNMEDQPSKPRKVQKRRQPGALRHALKVPADFEFSDSEIRDLFEGDVFPDSKSSG